MNTRLHALGLLAAAIAMSFGTTTSADDLRDGVPSDVYLALYGVHNPERDYQKEHFARVWETIEETRIIERFMQAIENQLDEDEVDQFQEARETLAEAVEPIQWEALADCTESVYAQRMAMPTSQHLVLLRLPEGAADGFVEGITNLLKLAEDSSDGRVSLVTETVQGVELHTLQMPPEVPFQMTVGAMGDVFLFASTREFATQSLELLKDPEAESKFDDPRLAEALDHLPQFEDALVFFDGRALFEELEEISTFIRQVSGGDRDAERVARFLEEVLGEVGVFDYEVTVEYTEGYQNRSAAFGRVTENAGETVIGEMFASQQPFENWDRWVPAEATGYSLATGADLHPLYEWIMDLIPRHFPEAQPGLDRFAALQDEFNLHLDDDLLQAFSGESVTVAIDGQSATFLKCDKPDRIRELLHRLVETLQGIPQLEAQNISLVEVDDLEGFEALNAGVLLMAGRRPVIGFHEGWMVIGTGSDIVQTILDTRAGSGETIVGTEAFQKFDLEVNGPIVSIAYSDLAAQTRALSQGIQQVGAMLPMIMGMAAQNGADLSAAREFLALLPSVGRIVGEFDFYESQLAVTQPGPDELSYTRHKVVLVRPPAESEAE